MRPLHDGDSSIENFTKPFLYKKMFLHLFLSLSLMSILNNLKVQAQPDNSSTQDIIHSEKLSELQSKRNEIEHQVQNVRKLLSSLYDVNAQLKKIEKEKNSAKVVLSSLELEMKNLAHQTIELENQNKNMKEQLKKRIRTLFKYKGNEVFNTIFSSHEKIDFNKNYKLLSYLARKDLTLIRSYENSIRTIAKKKNLILGKKIKYDRLQKNYLKKETNLVFINSQKLKILGILKTQKELAKREFEKLKNQSIIGQESDIEDNILENSILEMRGQLEHPISHPEIKMNYGLIKNMKYHVVLDHKGIFYSTPEGSDVQTIYHGIVAFSGEIEGYGQTIIIDHGDHYYSIYAFNKQILVHTGQKVNAGEVISKTGEVSLDYGLGLYFEVRHFSEPDDPLLWLKRII